MPTVHTTQHSTHEVFEAINIERNNIFFLSKAGSKLVKAIHITLSTIFCAILDHFQTRDLRLKRPLNVLPFLDWPILFAQEFLYWV